MRLHLMPKGDGEIQARVSNLLARHLAASNLLGRVQVAKLARKKSGRAVALAPAQKMHGLRAFDEGDAQDIEELLASFSTDLAQDEEADYIRALVPVIRDLFDNLNAQYKRDAFTLAGTADVRLIEKIRDALADVAQKGGAAADFETAVRKLTDSAGVAQLNAFTLDTAFNVAMQRAYSLGRYEQMKDPAVTQVLPYWQYWTVGDDRVRPEHAVLDGFTARAEDPVWRKIYPPNGFNCRCSVIPIPANEAEKDADEPGYSRLPLLARLKVPQPGFGKVF